MNLRMSRGIGLSLNKITFSTTPLDNNVFINLIDLNFENQRKLQLLDILGDPMN